MKTTYQVYNKRTKQWMKMCKYSNGKTRIMNVKQREPNKPFKGVKKK